MDEEKTAMTDDAALLVFCGEDERPLEVRAIQPPETERLTRQLPQQHANGWLLFTLGVERRRLAPLPPGWRVATQDQLRRWWADADPVKSCDGAASSWPTSGH